MLAWIVITVTTAVSGYSLWQQQQSARQALQPVSVIIAQQLADAAAPLVLDKDQLSLQALSARLSRHRQVRHVAIYDLDNQPLAQSGKARLRGSDVLANAGITFQNQLLGHTRVALRGTHGGVFSATQTLMLLCLGSAFICLLLLTRRPAEQAEAKPETLQPAQQPAAGSAGLHAVIAVELLQFPLLRQRLNEDTLYEYIATFQRWLRRVAEIYGAEISVADRGFTLLLQHADSEQLGSEATHCAYTLNTVLEIANPQRKQDGDLVYDARMGVHIATRRSNGDEVRQQLYLQEAERTAWQVCEGKANHSINLTPSVASLHCAAAMQLQHSSDDNVQLLALEDAVELKLNEQARQVLQRAIAHQDSMVT